MKNLTLILLLFLLVFGACNRTKKLTDYGEKVATIIKTEDGLFRGNNLGDDLYPVYENEKKTPTNEEDDYLYYEFKNDSGELFTIEYNFLKNKLVDIRTDAYFVEKSTAHQTFEDLKLYFTDKYGESNAEENTFTFASWKLANKAIIELSDESQVYKQGKISLIFYR